MKNIPQLDYTNNPGIKQSAKFLTKAVLRKTLMPKQYITLQHVRLKDDYTVVFDYSVSGNMKKYFHLENEFFIQYDFKINEVPKSILSIPFMTNVMPIAWVTDATLFVPEIDSEFAKNMNTMRTAFKIVQPKLDFKGKIKVKKIKKNDYKTSNKVAMGFSGGVDSFQTFTAHFDENPELITLIGSDIFFDDEEGVEKLISNTRTIAEKYGLDHHIIKTNFRGFLNERELDKITFPKVNDGYWHAVQHGVGVIGNMAPIAYHDKLKTFYFSSTFTKKEFKNRVSCSSWPITDESVKLSRCSVVHDGFDFSRQQKVHNIVEFSRKYAHIPLRVCWRSRGAKNCSMCEKCFRTIVALIVEREDPNNYGFNYSEKLSRKIREIVDNSSTVKQDQILAPLWRAVKQRAVENKEFIEKNYPELGWILEMRI